LVLIAAGVFVGLRPRRSPPVQDKLVINSAPRPTAQPQGAKSSRGKTPAPVPRAALGEYTQPAPGASVEILPDND
jgi:hypothetical protein